MKRILTGLFVAVLCVAQNAEVHDLLPSESSEGARLFKSMEDSKAAYECWTVKMSAKYLKAGGATGHGEFSPGFKHIVPPTWPSAICCVTTTVTPAIGIIGAGAACVDEKGVVTACAHPL